MELIRKGKVKEVYAIDSQTLLFVFTDNISVFDKIIPSKIPHKGETLCSTSSFWFEKLKYVGIKNHYLSSHGREMIVQRFKILEKPTREDVSYLIPLEFITRYYLAGSLYDRIKSGKINYRELGFKNMPEYGAPLPDPIFEITTKFEEYDRKVSVQEAMKIGGLSRDEIEEIHQIILKIDSMMDREVRKRGLIHVDGKKEFALNSEREIVVVDTFGTMDEDRWWDRKEYENGNIVQLSKEFVRQYYRASGYYEALKKAREEGREEPSIPPLPQELVERTSKLYLEMHERITGRKLELGL